LQRKDSYVANLASLVYLENACQHDSPLAGEINSFECWDITFHRPHVCRKVIIRIIFRQHGK